MFFITFVFNIANPVIWTQRRHRVTTNRLICIKYTTEYGNYERLWFLNIVRGYLLLLDFYKDLFLGYGCHPLCFDEYIYTEISKSFKTTTLDQNENTINIKMKILKGKRHIYLKFTSFYGRDLSQTNIFFIFLNLAFSYLYVFIQMCQMFCIFKYMYIYKHTQVYIHTRTNTKKKFCESVKPAK